MSQFGKQLSPIYNIERAHMNNIRLDKYLCDTFLLTRNEAKSIIKSKSIKVNDHIVTVSDYKVKETDKVYYNDTLVEYSEYIYFMMNKPKNYVCATFDNVNKTVLDLIKDYNTSSLMIVGRLDIDTTGLLIITNDGSLVHNLTNPKKECPKIYNVVCDKEFTKEDIEALKNGISISLDKDEIYKCKEAFLEINKDDQKIANITITEGKFHQVKKMCKAIDKNVLELKRLKVNNLELDSSLAEGQYRKLTKEEIDLLR